MRQSIKNFQARWVTHQYGGETFKVRIEDTLGQGWYDHDWEELPEIRRLATRKLQPGALVFDLGAHQSIVAMMLAARVSPNGQVVAVEANQHNAALGQLNVQENGIDNVKIIRAAVSNTVGTILMNEGLNSQIDNGTAAWGQVEVPSITIDELAKQHGMPNVVFVDIEGAECMALEGANHVLSQPIDFFVEVHVNSGLETLGGSIERVLSYFPQSRFDLVIRSENQTEFLPIQKNDPILKDRFFLLALSK
jgi:FkbM family methyltransferase